MAFVTFLGCFVVLVSAWDSSLRAEDVRVSLSPEAEIEWQEFLAGKSVSSLAEIEEIIPDKSRFPRTIAELNSFVQTHLDQGPGFFIVAPVSVLSFRQSVVQSWILSRLLGKTLAQNLDGRELYVVHDRGGRMELGARYSQTSQGGSFHTDGVNVKPGYDIFLLSAVTAAYQGGESIFVDGAEVVRRLNGTAAGRRVMETLSKPWAWEWKGVRQGLYYSAPVLREVSSVRLTEAEVQRSDYRFHWRYMRTYVEEAARRGGRGGLSVEEREAIDLLDSILEDPSLHWRGALRAGETAVINDREVFHGRTAFADLCGAVTLEAFLETDFSEPTPAASVGEGAKTCHVELTEAAQLMAAGHDASVRGSASAAETAPVVRRTYLRTWVDLEAPIEWSVPSPRDAGYMDAFADLEP